MSAKINFTKNSKNSKSIPTTKVSFVEKLLGIRKRELSAEEKKDTQKNKGLQIGGLRIDLGYVLVLCLCLLIFYLEFDNLYQCIRKKQTLFAVVGVMVLLTYFLSMTRHLVLHHSVEPTFENARRTKLPQNPAIQFAQEHFSTIIRCLMNSYTLF
jgi:hypothetical protein